MTDNVFAFERPPVRQTTIVRAGVEETAAELSAACALPGGYEGGAFTAGWAHILAGLTAMIEFNLKDAQ